MGMHNRSPPVIEAMESSAGTVHVEKNRHMTLSTNSVLAQRLVSVVDQQHARRRAPQHRVHFFELC